MLRASKRVLRAGGRTGYFTIVLAPDLTKAQHRRGVRLGPRAVTTTRPIGELMIAAGFKDVTIADVTDAFLVTARAWALEFDDHEQELRDVIGDSWDERQRDRQGIIAGIEEGLLHRLLVTATA